MNLSVTQAFPHLEAFHRANGQCIQYHAPETVTYSRGAVQSATAPTPRDVIARVNHNPKLEEVTAFGNPGPDRAGVRVIVKVLAKDLKPDVKGAFTVTNDRGMKRMDILAVVPLQRGGTTIRWDCLCGVE